MKKIIATVVLSASGLLSTAAHAGVGWNGLNLNGTTTGSSAGQVLAIELPSKHCPSRGCSGVDEPNGQSDHGVLAPIKGGGGNTFDIGNGPSEHGRAK